ncbi:unnamed protein product [Rhodiola kirilowii]
MIYISMMMIFWLLLPQMMIIYFFDANAPDDPVFLDDQKPDAQTTGTSSDDSQDTVDIPVEIAVPSVPRRTSTRVVKPPAWTKDYICNRVTSKSSPHQIQHFLSYSKCAPHHTIFSLQISSVKEPSSYTQASKDTQWVEAMNKEITALEGNNTWLLTDLPKDKTVVDCKWIYKIKYLADGSIERFRARLVARGFTQIEELDYHETFAPVAKMTTVRCLLAIAAARNWPLHQLDVDNAFLHGTLEEEVYMKLPPAFYKKEKAAGKVCKLIKSLYGLKQASRQWFAKFSSSLVEFGFQSSLNDYSLFTLTRGSVFLILLVYVDDVLITGNSEEIISEVKQFIHEKFRIKDLGQLKYFLGLEEHNLTDCKPAKTPMRLKHNLSMSATAVMADPLHYRRLVGKLIYLTITRPDLAYPVQILSQFMQHPTEDHHTAALRLLRFVKAAPAQGIYFSATLDLTLRAFCDVDWDA